jgi:glutamyl-tRNA synthetase
LGAACSALCAWLAARATGGAFLLRIEDIDRPRVVSGSAERIAEDLRWLGLDWDEGPDAPGLAAPYTQSQRTGLYEAAIALLSTHGHVFCCDCSRADIARAASAPHSGEQGPVYPGTCRYAAHTHRTFKRPPARRLAVPAGRVAFHDHVYGRVEIDVAVDAGDFVLQRGDGIFAYQLAVVVDDITQGITEVVRGADLLASTARQILLARLLGATPPLFGHAPLIVDPDGKRLAKRAHGISVRHHREAGGDPRAVVTCLARALGLAACHERHLTPSQLVPRFRWDRIARGQAPVDPRALLVGDSEVVQRAD